MQNSDSPPIKPSDTVQLQEMDFLVGVQDQSQLEHDVMERAEEALQQRDHDIETKRLEKTRKDMA